MATALPPLIPGLPRSRDDVAATTGSRGPTGAKDAKPPTGVDPAKWAEADAVAKDFETLFMDLVVKGMRQTAKAEEGSNANDIYTGMLDGEYARAMTGAQDFGVRDMILDWMKLNDPAFANGPREGRGAIEGTRAQALEAYKAQSAAKATK